ncbi:hypothetical protein Zmor_007897 [Zophobas morio]|uniref:RING-type domain-containing protein n=1 Tax=Zophobas morio TaxID=2755281 RepID=A0AA38IZ99_9CUCU|nr:hypothetical protein Zmor_007897 [Zophobas morio]
MMEIDRMSYIFGSFARRRQSQEVGSKRKSVETKISHDRSKSAPHTPKKSVATSPRARSICNFVSDEGKFKCPMCRRLFVEPKVLPCLHTFCLRCLHELEASDCSWCDEESDGKNLTVFPSFELYNVKIIALMHYFGFAQPTHARQGSMTQ